ncbi:MAG: protocatechuate dioxygenase [Chloroflexota bacterium]
MSPRPLYQSLISLLTVLMPFLVSRRTGFLDPRIRISRRAVLKLGGLAVTAITTGAWKTRLTGSTSTVFAAPGQCVLTPEQTEGPYYIPREKIRTNITEGRPGTALKLRLTVVDASTCKPIKDAVVDVWHCDAGGIYAGFMSASTGGGPPGSNVGPTDKRTFLRGMQKTNARGLARFQTIYPGWYRGRTVHIHVKVHLGGALVGHVAHTGQLYFPDSLTRKVYQTGVYRGRASARDTFNATDSIYQSGGAQSTLNITHDRRGGYVGTMTLGVRRV